MKKYFLLLALFFLFLNNIFAQQNGDLLWQQSNDLYEQKNYEAAINTYQKIKDYQNSPQVLFNLGNANYNQGKIGKAILNYKRSLKINSQNSAAKENLVLAQNKIENPISNQNFILKKWWLSFVNLIPTFVWKTICLLLALSITFSFIIYNAKKKKSTGILLIVKSILLLISISGLIGNKIYWQQENDAVAITGGETYFNDPNFSKTNNKTIPEGTTVRILEKNKNYWKVLLPNGVIAYTPPRVFEKV